LSAEYFVVELDCVALTQQHDVVTNTQQHDVVTNTHTQTDRQTDHATCVAVDRV